jgi:hypothetical protein
MRRPLLHKTGDRIGSTFFYVNTQNNNKKISHIGVYGKKLNLHYETEKHFMPDSPHGIIMVSLM